MEPFTPELLQQALDLVNSAGGAAYEAAYRHALVMGWLCAALAAVLWVLSARFLLVALRNWTLARETEDTIREDRAAFGAFIAALLAVGASAATLRASANLLATEWVAIRALLEVVR